MWDKFKQIFSVDSVPFASIGGAKKWFSGIANLDPAAKLATYLQAYAENHSRITISPNYVATMFVVDASLYDSFFFLREHYTQNPKMPKQMEEASWQQIVRYAEHQSNVWLHIVQSDFFDDLNEEARARSMSLVLRYINVIAKFYYFRFQPVPVHFWTLAHQVFRSAEMSELEAQPLILHPDASAKEGPTSCTDEYLTLIMLNTLSSSGLTLRQIEMVDQWLHIWSKGVTLDKVFNPDKHHYAIDFSQQSGPQRIVSPLNSPSARYVDCNDLLVQIDAARQLIRNGGADVSKLGLPDTIRHPSAPELLNFLHAHWSDTDVSKKRRAPRVMVNKLLDVALGFKHAAALIKADNIAQSGGEGKTDVDYDEMIDMRLYGFVSQRTKERQAAAAKVVVEETREQVPFETWLMQDESEGGFGVVLPFTRSGDDLKLGELLAIRLGEEENWHVATMRRVKQQENKHYFVGVQLLGVDPMIAMYRETTTKAMHYAATPSSVAVNFLLPKTAIFIPHGFQQRHSRTLLLQAEDFATGKILELMVDGKMHAMELVKVIEKGIGWVWCEVSVLPMASA
ncbi:hypothetical protein LIN78_01040 [Leeia sp. TBRC 13508]|uniref:Uncharacterized protein n=1 Tax=Leeia speluncae TaxID=2884804 RepID=A0ABS8D2D9_9NEIS|nr:hypothetical protein [Leeia speluncae]MCB6182141.1 hypothetical protein [Leeia speluncae]